MRLIHSMEKPDWKLSPACSSHGEDESSGGNLSVVIPVEGGEGLVISLSLFILQEIQLPVNSEDVHRVPHNRQGVHG